ncbi:uncharacterized protein LOC144883128 [Branchiostoma floridae x Branchiostoma japonicum]
MSGMESGRNQAVYDLSLVPPTILAESEEVKKVYAESDEKGHLPANRTNVLFLGDKRAGKTSLKRHLLENGFDPEEPSTDGIERELVQTEEVDEHWKEVKQSEYSEFQQGSALYTAIHVNTKGLEKTASHHPTDHETNTSTMHNTKGNSDDKNQGAENSFTKWTSYIRVVIVLFLPALFTFLEIINKFGPLLLLSVFIAWFILFKQFHWGQFAVCIGAAMIAVSIKYFHTSVVPMPESPLGIISVSLLGAAGSMVLGACCGLGLEGGMSLVLCCMQMYGPVTDDIQKFKKPTIYELVFETICVLIGVLLKARLKSVSINFKVIAFVVPFAAVLLGGCLPFGFTTMGITGLASGAATVVGLNLGRFVAGKMSLQRRSKVLLHAAAIIAGIIWGKSMGLSFVFDFTNVLCFSLLLLILIYSEIESKRRQRKYPRRLVGKSMTQFMSKDDLPKKMLLLDFAGDRLYYATHPLFISSHAIFLVVFSLARFAQNENHHMRRLIFWLHSIAAHAKNPECKVFLVGTHRDLVQRERRKQITKRITKKLGQYPRLVEMIVMNMVNVSDKSTHHTFVFCVENSAQITNDPEGLRLRETLMYEVDKAEHVRHEIPLRWLKFYDLTNRRKGRKGRKDYPKNCTSSTEEVWDMMQKEGIFKPEERDNFDLMLNFYDRVGEIKLMERFVVFDPQLVVDLLTNLLLTPVQDGALVPLKLMEKLCKNLNAPCEEAITILRQYDIICPILCLPKEEDITYAVHYIIPLKLRRLDRKRKVVEIEEDILSSDPENDGKAPLPFWQNRRTDVSFYFNFKKFNPEAVFIRLLARCLYVSQRSHDMSNGRNLYSDAGRFYQSNDFYYKIELCSPSDDQNLVQVTIGKAPESGVRELLCRIHRDIKDICDRDFPYVSYTFGIQCEACRVEASDDQPDQREHPRHILNLSTHEEDFPPDDKVMQLLCQRQVYEVDFRHWPDTIRMVEDNTSVFQPVGH